MATYKLIVEYDGTPFVGWQRQENGLAVQQVIEEAFKGFCGEDLRVRGAGRTDTGVHALGQVVDVTLEREFPADKVRDALNYHMKPHPIAVVSAEQVAEDFSARFDASQRHYLYSFTDRRAPLTLTKNRSWQVPTPLDADAMHTSAQCLVGQHDFTTFRASGCQAKSPVRTMDKLTVSRVGDEVHLNVSALSFLHSQIRSFAGSLKLVGEGKWSARDMRRALEAEDRSQCGPIAPPHGLYFVRVDY